LKLRGKGQIPQLGSKFRGPWKTVGPSKKHITMLLKWLDKCNSRVSELQSRGCGFDFWPGGRNQVVTTRMDECLLV